MFEFITVRELYELYINDRNQLDGIEYVELQGWIRTNRNSGKVGFLALNDGTYFKNVQVVYLDEIIDNYEEASHISTGSAVKVTGKLKLTPDGKQPFEIEATHLVVEGTCDEDFPLQKKRHSFEYMREIPHLRPRANTFYAIFRLRSVLSMAIHEFFQNQGFVYVHTPIITSNDGEGAGEMFKVTTLDLEKIKDGKVDYSKDFFGKPTSLTVSGQLQAETWMSAFKKVYTFGPTFRAENSNTKTHANEFWMIEPEIAFCDLEQNMDIMEDMLKYIVKTVLEKCSDEIEFLNKFVDKTLKEKLTKLVNSKFTRITHEEVITILKNSKVDFEFTPEYGEDIAKEHEKYITEYFNGPVFITNWPKDIKAFYMKQNEDGKTVAAVDLEVPGAGELMGGSQREENYEKLLNRMKELNMNTKELEWYLNLRRYGTCIHSGFGMGFERLLIYLTGVENIRDVIPYPRTPGNCEF